MRNRIAGRWPYRAPDERSRGGLPSTYVPLRAHLHDAAVLLHRADELDDLAAGTGRARAAGASAARGVSAAAARQDARAPRWNQASFGAEATHISGGTGWLTWTVTGFLSCRRGGRCAHGGARGRWACAGPGRRRPRRARAATAPQPDAHAAPLTDDSTTTLWPPWFCATLPTSVTFAPTRPARWPPLTRRAMGRGGHTRGETVGVRVGGALGGRGTYDGHWHAHTSKTECAQTGRRQAELKSALVKGSRGWKDLPPRGTTATLQLIPRTRTRTLPRATLVTDFDRESVSPRSAPRRPL